jgi:hypothetical protein
MLKTGAVRHLKKLGFFPTQLPVKGAYMNRTHNKTSLLKLKLATNRKPSLAVAQVRGNDAIEPFKRLAQDSVI